MTDGMLLLYSKQQVLLMVLCGVPSGGPATGLVVEAAAATNDAVAGAGALSSAHVSSAAVKYSSS